MSLSKLQENGEGQRRLAGCSLWGRKELDTTEQLNTNRSTGDGRDLVGHQTRDQCCGTTTAHRGEGTAGSVPTDGRAGRRLNTGRTQMQTAASLLTVGCGHGPRAGLQGGKDRPAGHRDARRCSVHTESQGPGAECTPDSRAPTPCESAHCCLLGPENHMGVSAGNRDVWGDGNKVTVNMTGKHPLNNKPHL